MVRDANGHLRLEVSPSCKGVIRSLSNLEYKAGASVSDPKSDHSHMADAIRYASVAFAKGLLPWSVGQSGFRVVYNPSATKPIIDQGQIHHQCANESRGTGSRSFDHLNHML